MYRSSSFLSSVLVLFVVFGGCSYEHSSKPLTVENTISVTDDVGRNINVPLEPARVISLSPEATEIVYALGAEEALVGVVAECDYPPQASELPQVGSFSTPSYEAILGLEPDLVLATGHEQEGFVDRLSENGIVVLVIYPKTVSGVQEDIRLLGKILAKEDESEQLATKLGKDLAEIRNTLKGAPRPRVYIEIADQPMMTASDGSLVAELLDVAGGDNIAKGLPRPYCRIEPERVMAADPQVIVLAHVATTMDALLVRPGWKHISAVKENRIIDDIDPSLIFRAGPRMAQGARALAHAFHPHLVPE